jgi:F420-dependent oxidoreductase-like protein
VQDLAVPGVGRLAVEDELCPDAAADLLVQVRVGEEALPRATGLGRKVRSPEALRLRARTQLLEQRLRGLVLAPERGLVRVDMRVHEGAVTGAQLLDLHRVSIAGVRLGFYMSYAPPRTNPVELVALGQEAERLGFDSAWAAEAWGSDAVTVLSWLAATTSRIKVGSAIMQIPGRSPANTAMTAATLDLMSGGRFLLGLGTSGPQVVEGWHGQRWGKPLGKTREYVEIVRTILRRETLEHHGEHYDIPYAGEGSTGLGRPLKLMLHPLRAEIPIYLAALGPKNVALAAEIADGWLPIFFSPDRFADVFGPSLNGVRKGFDIAPSVQVVVGSDVQAGRDALKPLLALSTSAAWARARPTSTTRSHGVTATRPRPSGSRSSTCPDILATLPRLCPTRWWTRSPSSANASGSRTGSTPGASPA